MISAVFDFPTNGRGRIACDAIFDSSTVDSFGSSGKSCTWIGPREVRIQLGYQPTAKSGGTLRVSRTNQILSRDETSFPANGSCTRLYSFLKSFHVCSMTWL